MGIVGVNSTAGREVKFIDPSKTTKSESSWLGYTLCDQRCHAQHTIDTETHNSTKLIYCEFVRTHCVNIITLQ